MSRPVVGGYINAKKTIEAAALRGQSVTDYLDGLWNCKNISIKTVETFEKFGALGSATRRICEIGAGAGLVTEPLLERHKPDYYESYELDVEWAAYLSRTYPVISQPTSGDRLGNTPPDSIDLVHANGVFVYTPFLVSIKYFCEIFRVVNKGGYAVFDILSEPCFAGELLISWLKSGHHYPCILPQDYVKKLFIVNGFDFVGESFMKAEEITHYLAFRKK